MAHDATATSEKEARPVSHAAHSLLHSLGQLGSTLADYGKARLSMLGDGIEAQFRHATQMLIGTVLAVMLFGIGLIMAGLAVVIAFWDTPQRLLAAVLVAVGFFVLAGIVWLVLRAKERKKPSLVESATQAALLLSAYKWFRRR